MAVLYGLVFNILWVLFLVKNIRLINQMNDIQKENTQLKDKISNLERSVREEANKNIILESILKKRNNNQDGERRIY